MYGKSLNLKSLLVSMELLGLPAEQVVKTHFLNVSLNTIHYFTLFILKKLLGVNGQLKPDYCIQPQVPNTFPRQNTFANLTESFSISNTYRFRQKCLKSD